MNKNLLILLFAGIAVFVFTYLSQNQKSNKTLSQPQIDKSSQISQPTTHDSYPISASFEIYINGLKRDFSAAMYHELSENAYIESKKPYNVIVTKPTTWQEFFDTLPFKLAKDCITTGTGQTFCSNETKTLKFYLYDIENPNLLDLPIKDGDVVSIRYEK